MKTFKMIDPNLIRLYRYFMPYKWRLGFACVFLMGSASMSSITAILPSNVAVMDDMLAEPIRKTHAKPSLHL